MDIVTVDDCHLAGSTYGYPYLLKKKRFAYDGHGNYVVHSAEDISTGFKTLGATELYAERWVPFVKELAVMVVKTNDNKCVSYPVVETIQEHNICHLVIAPALVDSKVQAEASKVALDAIASFACCGIFGVELFLLPDGSILLNEIAPRWDYYPAVKHSYPLTRLCIPLLSIVGLTIRATTRSRAAPSTNSRRTCAASWGCLCPAR